MSKLKVTAPKDEPIIIMTRTLNAPPKLVWRAWTDPVHTAVWWGAKQFGPIRVEKMDVRPGGEWRFIQTGADGQTMAFIGRYLEVEEPTKIVNTFGVEGLYDPEALTETHTFEAQGDVTLYTSVSRFRDFASRDGMMQSGMEVGAVETMNQLDALLQTLKE